MTEALRTASVLVSFFVLTSCVTGQNAPDQFADLVAHVRAMTPPLLTSHGAAGLAVAIVDGGKTVYAEGFGWADLESHTPASPDTLFNVASVSKPVTALGVLRLARKHGLSLDDSVPLHLRRWRFPDDAADPSRITIRRVLEHRAGLSLPSVPWYFAPQAPPELERVLDGEAGGDGLRVVHPPGEFAYSGGGYAMLQLLVEETTGESFDDYMHEAVFDALEMPSTTFAQPPAPTSGGSIATGYDDDGERVRPYVIVGVAAGGLYSTARDLARLVRAYTPQARSTALVITEQEFQDLFAETAAVQYPGVAPSVFGGALYGLGHGVHHCTNGALLLYHSGGNPGFMAYLIIAPDHGRGLVMLANSSNAKAAMEEVRSAWAAHYGYDLPAFF